MTQVLGVQMPESWSSSPLKHVVSFLNRGSAPDYTDDSGIRVIGQAANQEFGIEWRRTRFHNYCGDARDLKGYLREADVIINSTGTGTLGRVGFFTTSPDGNPCMADSHVTIARFVRHLIHPRFAYYWLRSQLFQDYVHAALVVGATNQTELNRDRLSSAPIVLPPLDEQMRIADFLNCETKLIEAIRHRTRLQLSLLQDRVNETTRLATTVGNGPAVPTGISWMPEMNQEWHLRKVSHVFKTGSGTTPFSDEPEYYDGPYPWVNSADVNDGEIWSTERSVTATALSRFPTLKIHPQGSLIVALYGQGATKGKVGVLRINACLNQACCALVPTGPVLSEYALYWFRAHKQGIVGLALGAGQPNLSQELIRKLKIPAPAISRQQGIANELRRIEIEAQRKSDLLASRERLLDERRQALITAAVTGQFDVSTASGRGIED